MDLNNISRFLAVIDQTTFARAAKTVGVTPQAIAFSIAKLERELDVTLFERESGGVTKPTEYALALEDYARNLVVNERQAFQAVQSLKEAETGWIRLGVGETMTGSTIAQLIANISAELPKVKIALIENYTDRLIERMKQGEIDLIAGAPISRIEHGDKLVQHVLFESTDVIVARTRHPLAKKHTVSLSDMQGFTWLVPYARQDTYDEIVTTYLQAKLEPPKSFIFSDAPTLGQALIQSNDYLILSPSDMVHLDDAGGMTRIAADRPALKRTACLIYPADRSLSELTKLVRDRIIDMQVSDPAHLPIKTVPEIADLIEIEDQE